MIVDKILAALIWAFKGLANGMLSLVPAPPSWMGTGVAYTRMVFDYLGAFETWIPIDFAFTCALAVVSVYVISMVAEITRLVLSFATFGGGAK